MPMRPQPPLIGAKTFRQLLNEHGLLLRSKHEIAVALFGGSQGSENSPANAKVGAAHVRAFFGTFEAEGDAAEVVGGHMRQKRLRKSLTQIFHTPRQRRASGPVNL